MKKILAILPHNSFAIHKISDGTTQWQRPPNKWVPHCIWRPSHIAHRAWHPCASATGCNHPHEEQGIWRGARWARTHARTRTPARDPTSYPLSQRATVREKAVAVTLSSTNYVESHTGVWAKVRHPVRSGSFWWISDSPRSSVRVSCRCRWSIPVCTLISATFRLV